MTQNPFIIYSSEIQITKFDSILLVTIPIIFSLGVIIMKKKPNVTFITLVSTVDIFFTYSDIFFICTGNVQVIINK